MSEQENEKEAVRTTIVGGRPPGSGRSNVSVPRGIEVLVKKAAVDAEFRELLLAQRGKAAGSIQLELDPAETAMLSAIAEEQLARIVDLTEVATELRPALAGRVGAVMLAALGAGLVTSSLAEPASVLSDQPRGAASAPEVSTSANPFLLAQGAVVAGNVVGYVTKRSASHPRTNSPPPNPSPSIPVAGATVTPPTNPPPTNLPPSGGVNSARPDPPPTNKPPAKPQTTNTLPVSRGIRPDRP